MFNIFRSSRKNDGVDEGKGHDIFIFNFDMMELYMGESEKTVSLIKVDKAETKLMQNIYLSLLRRVLEEDLSEEENREVSEQMENAKSLFFHYYHQEFPGGKIPQKSIYYLVDKDKFLYENVDGKKVQIFRD